MDRDSIAMAILVDLYNKKLISSSYLNELCEELSCLRGQRAMMLGESIVCGFLDMHQDLSYDLLRWLLLDAFAHHQHTLLPVLRKEIRHMAHVHLGEHMAERFTGYLFITA